MARLKKSSSSTLIHRLPLLSFPTQVMAHFHISLAFSPPSGYPPFSFLAFRRRAHYSCQFLQVFFTIVLRLLFVLSISRQCRYIYTWLDTCRYSDAYSLYISSFTCFKPSLVCDLSRVKMGIINFGKSEKKISIGFSQKKKKKNVQRTYGTMLQNWRPTWDTELG